ncbi:hypothetical protein QYE76_006936 [Lolium multiflorum]|uniref:DUF4219 domain-containing protein n=1 Tax=Lolium multiflorum TaxID=4521 RepID=A0AAD8RZ80_LOLMU|nr:hypothetical protein QYE76_006936 [Lolium multiflorum]
MGKNGGGGGAGTVAAGAAAGQAAAGVAAPGATGAAAPAAAASATTGRTPPPQRSPTPPRTRSQSRGRSRSRRNGGKEIVVREAIYQERPAVRGGVLVWPMLTSTNYIEWALLMQINMEACVLWDAVEGNAPSVPVDKAALAAILRVVPADMQAALLVKCTAKEAWEAVKMMRFGVNRKSIVNNLRSLGDQVEEVRVVEKILREVPKEYAPMACSIETLLDLSTVSVEELLGRLRSSEGRGGGSSSTTNNGGSLLLTEEEWEKRHRQREQGQGQANNRNGNGGKKGKAKAKNGNDRGGERDMT